MRVTFAGSATFSLPCLAALVASEHRVELVLTAPDRAGSRGRPAPRPVRELARELGLPVAQPERLQDSGLAGVSAWESDLLVVCAYGQLLPAGVLGAFPRGALGVHPSLLPHHRGASPIATAILEGEAVTGVSIYQMDRRLDAGPLLAQAPYAIPPRTTTPSLAAAMAPLAAKLLVTTVDRLERGELIPVLQDEAVATYCAKVSRRDGEAAWDMSAGRIDRMVRALQPWPGTSAELAGARVKLLLGEPIRIPEATTKVRPGTVVAASGDSVIVMTGSGGYRLDAVQPAGSKPMAAAAYLRGRHLAVSVPSWPG